MMPIVELISVISSIIAILQGAEAIYEICSETAGIPKAFSTAALCIPLVCLSLEQVQSSLRSERCREEALEAATLVLAQCEGDAQSLKDIFDKTLPSKGDGKLELWKKISRMRLQRGNVKRLMQELLRSFDVLAKHQLLHDTTMIEDIQAGLQHLAEISDSDDDREGNTHLGTGHIYSYKGSGNQNNVSGDQYNASSQSFGWKTGNHSGTV